MRELSKNSLIGILDRLIAFETVTEQPNISLLNFISDYLGQEGIESEMILEPCGDRGSLVALVGPPEPGGIVLSGHSDVVSVEGQEWTVPPWRMTSLGSRYFGRGTADMKGFIACCLEQIPLFRAAPLKRPVILAISRDEEAGCKGAPALVQHILQSLPRPAAVFVGEPTNMRVVSGHKGVAVYETTVRGQAGHSSQPELASSAIQAAARLITHIEGLADGLRGGRRCDGFTPPYTTTNVGIVRGGEASNIVAAECRFRWDVRPVPGHSGEAVLDLLHEFADREILPEMKSIADDAEVTSKVVASAPPLAPDGDQTAKSLALDIGKLGDGGMVSFTTEAGIFQRAGISAVVCGPGSIEQAHKPDEFIEYAQLEACGCFIRRLVDSLVD